MNMLFMCIKVKQRRISELQQQVEDLQKALQTQGAKPEDVMCFMPFGGAVFAPFLSVIHDALLNDLVFDFFLEVTLLLCFHTVSSEEEAGCSYVSFRHLIKFLCCFSYV